MLAIGCPILDDITYGVSCMKYQMATGHMLYQLAWLPQLVALLATHCQLTSPLGNSCVRVSHPPTLGSRPLPCMSMTLEDVKGLEHRNPSLVLELSRKREYMCNYSTRRPLLDM